MTKKILIINGPNLNLLGEREESKYGKATLDEVKKNCEVHAKSIGLEIKFQQSNIEGEIVTMIQKAKDVFQEAMIIFYEKVMNEDFKLTASIQTYLFAVCKNLWLKDLRDNRKEIPVDLQGQKDFDGAREEDPFFQSDRISTLTKSVQEYLIKLGNPCRKILIYYYYFKYSMETISEKLGYASSDSVKSQKYKCIERLKRTVPSRIKTLLYTS